MTRTLGSLDPRDLADLERVVLTWRERARADETERSPTGKS